MKQVMGGNTSMTPEEKQAYEWALSQKLDSVSARNARILAQYIQRTMRVDSGIVGQTFFVESPNFEGMAVVTGVNEDDTVRVRSDYTGAIYTVDNVHLIERFA